MSALQPKRLSIVARGEQPSYGGESHAPGGAQEIKRIDREMEKLVQALLAETLPTAIIKERSSGIEARKIELETLLARAQEPLTAPPSRDGELLSAAGGYSA